MDINDIDWNALWRKEAKESHWNKLSRDAAANRALWDKRADKFNKRVNRIKDGAEMDNNDYIVKMLARIEVDPAWSVLDIGCGPGTLAIPLARKAGSVTALDVSSEMLKHLQRNAAREKLDNITCLNCPWEEAGGRVGVHDVVVASRSLSPVDIVEMLSGVDAVTGRAAYLTFPVIHLPFDWEVYRAIGRGGKKHPSYIYIFNQLYQMGIQANVEVLHSRVKMQFAGVADAIEDLQWRTDPFTPEEKEKLTAFLEGKFTGRKGFAHEGWSQWALIWWRKDYQPKETAR